MSLRPDDTDHRKNSVPAAFGSSQRFDPFSLFIRSHERPRMPAQLLFDIRDKHIALSMGASATPTQLENAVSPGEVQYLVNSTFTLRVRVGF